MTDAKQAFSELKEDAGFRRVDAVHVLNLYYGYDPQGRATLLLVSSTQPQELRSSRIISAEAGKRKDGKWALSFALQRQEYKDLFYSFCNDMVESSRGLKLEHNGAEFLCKRYCDWQQMMAQSSIQILSKAEIKGLAGEMLFLLEYMIPKYGCQQALDAWTGPARGDQDFITAESWYEIKTVSSGTEEIRISSAEQLDRNDEGYLVVQFMDTTGADDPKGITLNGLYEKICACLETDVQRKQFAALLWQQGFAVQTAYDKIAFRPGKRQYFQVNADFPCIRQDSLPLGVSGVNYLLSLSAIASFKKEQEHGC